MNIKKDVALAAYSTMGLGGQTDYQAAITSKEDLIEALSFARDNKLKVLMIGGGSNVIWRDEGFRGILLSNEIRGFEIEHEDDKGADLLIGAGENWDSVVDRAVSLGLSGIECLSLIPGTAGATPIQNVGAYGQEIAESLTSLDAYDLNRQNFLTMSSADCEFRYRNSLFKKEPGRYLILSIRLHLNKSHLKRPLYTGLEQALDDLGITDTSPKTIRERVVAIRQAKLPDVRLVKNCGSFFHNPIVPLDKYKELHAQYKDISHWQMSDGRIKLSAAWLIDQAGFRDYTDQETGIATWPGQPLIAINQRAKSTADLLAFRDKIATSVMTKFGVTLVLEPQLLP